MICYSRSHRVMTPRFVCDPQLFINANIIQVSIICGVWDQTLDTGSWTLWYSICGVGIALSLSSLLLPSEVEVKGTISLARTIMDSEEEFIVELSYCGQTMTFKGSAPRLDFLLLNNWRDSHWAVNDACQLHFMILSAWRLSVISTCIYRNLLDLLVGSVARD